MNRRSGLRRAARQGSGDHQATCHGRRLLLLRTLPLTHSGVPGRDPSMYISAHLAFAILHPYLPSDMTRPYRNAFRRAPRCRRINVDKTYRHDRRDAMMDVPAF